MERRKQILELQRRFDKDFEAGLANLTNEEQLIVTSFYKTVLPIFQERAEGYYDRGYSLYEKQILEGLRAKAKPIYNLRMLDYFVKDSMKLVHVQHDFKVDNDDQFLSDEELDDFLVKISRLVNLKHQMLLLIEPEKKSEERKIKLKSKRPNEEVQNDHNSEAEEKPVALGDHEEYMSIAECAEFLNCSLPTVHAYKNQGMPHYKIGRTVRFKKSEVLNFMRQQEKVKRKK